MIGITWMIEGDIKSYFDSIDHHILEEIFKRYINPDQNLINLYWKLVKAGYIEQEDKFRHSITGVPQGGIISPLFANLYLTPFDEFMDQLKREWERLPVSVPNKEYREVQTRIQNYRRKLQRNKSRTEEEVKEIKTAIIQEGKRLRQLPSATRTGCKIYYVRYADDWVIGVIGTKKETEMIKDQVKRFLAGKLKLELNEDKTKITHLGSEYASFLGYNIKVPTLQEHISSRRRSEGTCRACEAGEARSARELLNIRKSSGKPKLIVPKGRVKSSLIEKGLATEKGKPKAIGKFIFLPDGDIILRYNSILRGIMNYYNLAEDRTSLSEAVYVIKFSLAHTLAAKHRCSIKKIFTKYGQGTDHFRVKIPGKDKEIAFDLPTSRRCTATLATARLCRPRSGCPRATGVSPAAGEAVA